MKTSLLLILALVGIAIAQAPDTLWTRTVPRLNFEHDEFGRSVTSTTDGGCLVGAKRNGSNQVLKFDTMGNLLWAREYSYAGTGTINLISRDDGGFLFSSIHNPGFAGVPFVACCTSDGDTLWTRMYELDEGFGVGENAITQVSSGGYLYVGVGDGGVSALRLDDNGNELWQDFYSEIPIQLGLTKIGVVALSVGSFLTVVSLGGPDPNPEFRYFHTLVIDSSGIVQSHHSFFQDAGAISLAMIPSQNGHTLAAISLYNDLGYWGLLMTIDGNGDSLWTSGFPIVSDMVEHDDGTLICAGSSLFRADTSGHVFWSSDFAGIVPVGVVDFARGSYFTAGSIPEYDENGEGPFYSIFVAKTTLEIPSGLTILSDGGNTILDWRPTGAPSYLVWGRASLSGPGEVIVSTAESVWTDTAAQSRTTPYYYNVSANSP